MLYNSSASIHCLRGINGWQQPLVATTTSAIYRHFSFSNLQFCNYKVLGLEHTATNKQIKQAYYEKSKQYHPDVNSSPDAAEKFQQLTSAYEMLNNDKSRSEYDRVQGYKQSLSKQNFHSKGVSSESVHFNRNLYKRMRKNTNTERANYSNFQGTHMYTQKIKTEEEFYENLSEEMKIAYHNYNKRMEEERRKTQEQTELFVGSDTMTLSLLFCIGGFFVVCACFEMFGQSYLLEPLKLDSPKKNEKNIRQTKTNENVNEISE